MGELLKKVQAANSLFILMEVTEEIKIIKLLGKGKSGYSYLSEVGGRKVIFKQMHDEPCPYYNFSDNKVKLERKSYALLKEAGISIPELISYNEEKNFLIKEYIEGSDGIEYLASGSFDEKVICELFKISRILKSRNLNIDYFPANFVISSQGLSYIDYEVNPFDARWSLENWGVYFWANREGMRKYHADRNWRHIIENPNEGIPPKDEFRAAAEDWILRFS